MKHSVANPTLSLNIIWNTEGLFSDNQYEVKANHEYIPKLLMHRTFLVSTAKNRER